MKNLDDRPRRSRFHISVMACMDKTLMMLMAATTSNLFSHNLKQREEVHKVPTVPDNRETVVGVLGSQRVLFHLDSSMQESLYAQSVLTMSCD